ncbi:effector protein steA, partial [Salmonella enterica]|nr:effector protein steA [Salmonella enterica]
MRINSAQTYARAFTANTQLHEAAGNYENKLATKIAKGIVGVLTLGIGYGLIRLIENCYNVRNKINDYCANAENIYNGIAVAIATGNNVAEIKLK